MTASNSNEPIERSHALSAHARRALAEAEVRWASTFGTGSRLELCDRFVRALGAARATGPAEDLEVIGARVEREHRAAHGEKRLAAELADERARDAATSCDASLVAYSNKWTARLAKLQQAHPDRWRVPGFSDDELRDELTLRLIDAVRTRPDERARHHRAAREWGLCFMAHQRAELRRDFQLEVVLADVTPALDRDVSEEERLIAHESERMLAVARERAEMALSRPQRRWFAAMRMTANAGAFFESSGRLNLAAVSRVLDKDRSSAHRAFAELRQHFTRELKKLGG